MTRQPRRVEVAPERLERWIDGVRARHPDVTVARDGARVEVASSDGFRAVGEGFEHDPLALILIRRGGYAVAVAEAGALTAHKVGSRYVQSRTAAGGWSQQRYARRRGNQADELVGAAAAQVERLITGPMGGLVVGGDRTLVAQLLEQPACAALGDLPRRDLPDLPDPKFAVLEKALARGRAVRFDITDP